MKKHISIVLLLVLILTNTIAFAAPGDIIHTGLKKVYRKTIDDNLLVEDVLDQKVEKDKFFREIEVDGNVKFVNIVKEEEAHENWIIDNMPKDLDLTNEEAVGNYLLSQASKLEEITKEIAKDFHEIGAGMTWEEYQGYHNAPKLKTPDNYSIPEPGFKEGTTRLATLKLPTEASKWQIQISDNEVLPMKKDTLLKDGRDYLSNRDIDIDVGKYLVLYAVDKDNKIKAYENIKITENMINTPKESATKIEVGKISEGEKYAGAVKINELDGKLPEGTSRWQIFISPIPVEKVYKVKMTDATDYNAGDDVVVAKENELHPIADSFRRYLVLLAVDNEDIVQGYNTFEIGKDNVSKAPSLLIENTHYKGPVPGDSDGTTKFTELHIGLNPDENMKDAESWKAWISKEPIAVPKLNAADTAGTVLSVSDFEPGKEFKASIGDYLLLTAVGNGGQIKGYRIFHLTENMVKGKTAAGLEEDKNYSTPSKGTIQGTTKINYLNLTGIEGATKWMYKVSENLANPILNKVVEGSSDYTAGQNIRANVGDDFLLLATDNEGKVKAFAKISLTSSVIADPPAILLREGVNYVGPVKGDNPGTTKFESLSGSASIGENPGWMYVVSDEEPVVPELDGKIEDIDGNVRELVAKESIGGDLLPSEYLMLLATDNNKIKGYAIFRLNEANIKMGPAILLEEDKHYSPLEKGTGAGTTRIASLNSIGIEGVEQWRYKIDHNPFLGIDETIEFNTIIPQTTLYSVGNNIRAEVGDYLLLLATDRSGRVKGYVQLQLGEEQVTKPNATLLLPNTNYIGPKAGTDEGTTRFSFLDFSTNVKDATKWMYVIGDKSFGNIELDSVIEEAQDLAGANGNIKASNGDYLLLLATDAQGKVKSYREFRLSELNIRGGDARVLNNENYTLEKGNKPGTTKFAKLTPLGMEGSIRWKYKLMENELDEKEKPYLNSLIEDTNFVAVGQDIDVSKFSNENGYGYMLLLAVDGSGRTKGYAEIKIESAVVKEHAPILNVELKEGSVLDSVKITGTQPTNTSIKYVIGYREFPIPAVDEVLNGGISYELEKDILQVKIGDYIAVYEVDADNKIKAFNGFKITTDDIKKGSATIADITLLEGSINNGGSKIEIQLENGKWASDLKTNADKRQALYNGFKANNEPQEWAKVVASLVKDGSGAVDIDDNNKLTLSLPETKDYDIAEDQEITLVVPALAIENATNPINAGGKILIKPTIKATIAGDVVTSVVRENDIKAGGKEIVIELTDGDWIGDIDSKDNVDNLIGGFKVMGVDDHTQTNWYKIAGKIEPENVVRNSSKKLTITLPKVDDVSFGVNKEIISLTIPESLIQGAKTEVVATPTFTLYPNVLQVAGKAVGDKDTVALEAPDGRVPMPNMDIWKVEVTTGTLKDSITDKDIIVSGLPRGLRANVIGVDGNIITIKVSGTAATKIEEMEVQVKVKGEAVEEPNSLDSEDIKLYLKISETIESKLKDVNYDLRDENGSLKIYLVNADNEMEYSINSTNGINGNWISASSGPDGISLGDAEPIKIWVREKAQPKVFRLVGELKYRPAPVYVKISQYNYSDTGLEIVLEGPTENENIEYSTNGGENWSPINAGEFIELDADSDLRIRYKAVPGVGGKLPSLSTEKLNGLYLGNVKLNVAEGVIENTTTNMEYSTDREKYTQARNGNTPVNFVKDTEIWIRERGKGNEINRRILGKVGQMEFNEIDLDKVDYDISEGKISLENSPELALGEYEYKIANDPWKDVDDGKNIEFKAGSLQFRKKGDTTNLPSEAREKAVIAPPAPAPELSYDDTNHTIEKIGTNEGIIYEYSIDSGSWNLGDKDPEFKAGQEVRIREKAKARQLASEIQTIRFTPNLDLSNVYLDAGKSMIINTTTEMEYSLNSTDGLDGQWYKASSPNTNIPLKKNMTVWIREAEKPKNNRELGDGPMKERILNKKIIEERIGYSIKDNTIWIKTGKDLQWLQDTIDNLQYRNGGNTWINVPYTKLEQDKINILAYNIGFKPGKLEFRLKGDQNNLPSKPVEKNTIKANASAPNVEVDYVEDKVISINSIDRNGNWDIFEYNIDNGPWISGRYLKTEDLSGEKILRIRTAATASELPSQEVVIHFKEKLPLEHVILSTHVKPLELNGTTTQMEYRVNDGPWQPCQDKNTKLKRMDGSDLNNIDVVNTIIIRDKNQIKNQYQIWPK